MAIDSLDKLVASMPAKKLPSFVAPFTAQAANCFTSLIRKPGAPGAGIAQTPGIDGAICDDTLSGAWTFVNPTPPAKTYLSTFVGYASVAGTLVIYDRLWHNSGLSVTSTSAQNITQPSLTRYTDGIGVEAWLEVTTALGSNATAPTISYTNTDNTASRTGTVAGFVGSSAVDRTYIFSLQAGDLGIKSIQSYNNGATKTSGALNLTLRKRLLTVFIPAGTTVMIDLFETGLLELPDDTCLETVWLSSATSSTFLFNEFTVLQG